MKRVEKEGGGTEAGKEGSKEGGQLAPVMEEMRVSPTALHQITSIAPMIAERGVSHQEGLERLQQQLREDAVVLPHREVVALGCFVRTASPSVATTASRSRFRAYSSKKRPKINGVSRDESKARVPCEGGEGDGYS